MTTIVEVPGVGEVEFPDSMSQQDISTAIQGMKGQIIPNAKAKAAEGLEVGRELIPGVPQTMLSGVGSGPDSSAREAGTRAALSQFLGNLANVPNLALTAAANIPSVRSMLPPQDVMNVPKVGDRVLPTPSGEQISAGLETGLQVPGAILNSQDIDLNAMFGKNLADAEALAQEHPVATQVGSALGDGATLATGRVPVRRLLRRNGKDALDPEVAQALDDKAVAFTKSMGRGVARAAETGVEGAVLALLDEGDPIKTAMFAAGGQAAGSAAINILKTARKNPANAFVKAWMGIQVWKAVGPSHRDVFDASDGALNGLIGSYALGTTAALLGTGRVPKTMFRRDSLDLMAEAVNSGARGGALYVVKELAREEKEGGSNTATVVERLSQNPDHFGENVRKRLERAINSGKEGELVKEVDRLMKNKDFREKLDQ